MFWNELLAALGFKNPSEHVRFEFPIDNAPQIIKFRRLPVELRRLNFLVSRRINYWNEDTRRAGGMHFTSRANILKLIKPLFLDVLHDEFDESKRKTKKNRRLALKQF